MTKATGRKSQKGTVPGSCTTVQPNSAGICLLALQVALAAGLSLGTFTHLETAAVWGVAWETSVRRLPESLERCWRLVKGRNDRSNPPQPWPIALVCNVQLLFRPKVRTKFRQRGSGSRSNTGLRSNLQVHSENSSGWRLDSACVTPPRKLGLALRSFVP